jgi:hypothetical protein
VYYGITAVYDDNQESYMTIISTPTTIGSGHNAVQCTLWVGNDTGSQLLPDARITGYNIYRAITSPEKVSPDDFFLMYSIDADDGLLSDDNGDAAAWSVQDTNYYRIQFKDLGYEKVEIYTDRTGYTEYNQDENLTPPWDVEVSWINGAMVSGRMIVIAESHREQGRDVIDNKRLYVSRINMPDVFLPLSFIDLGNEDGSKFKGIAPLGKEKFVVWDDNNCYVINSSTVDPIGWFLEKTYKLGLGNGNAWTIIPSGLAFANEDGVFAIDFYGAKAELTRDIRTEWASVDTDEMTLYFDDRKDILYMANIGGNSVPAPGYMMDFQTKGFMQWFGVKASTNIRDAKSVFKGFNNVVYLAQFDSGNNQIDMFEIASGSSQIDADYKSPHHTIQPYAVKKRTKYLHLHYLAAATFTVNVYFDGATAVTHTFVASSSATVTTAKLRIPGWCNTVQIGIDVNATTGTFELFGYGIEVIPNRPR